MLSDLLIVKVRQIAGVASVDSRFPNDVILSIADEELKSGILPAIKNQKEDYFVFDQDLSLVANKFSYQIPARAIGGALKEVCFLHSNGRLERIQFLDSSDISEGCEVGFAIKNNKIVLNYRQLDLSKKLRLTYFIRPSKLVQSTAASKIISLTVANGQTTVQVDQLPSALNTSLIDVIRGDGSHECLVIDQSPNISGTTLIFNTEIDDIKKGDYLAVAGESPFAQLPEEMNMVLVQRTVCKVIESLGDPTALAAAEANLAQISTASVSLLSPRVESQKKVYKNKSNPLRWR